MLNEPLAKIHTQLIDGGHYPAWAKQAGLPAIAPFWFYVRAQARGTGKAMFSLQAATDTFAKSEKTVKRWLTIGTRYGLFHHYETSQGKVFVYHTGLFRVCQILSIANWGATAEVTLKQLQHAKVLAAEIQAEQMQRSSRYLAKRQARKEGYRGEIAKPEHLITSSAISTGALVKHVSERHIFVGEIFKVYGASQEGIGQALGRSERTIRRRLSNPMRKAKGLPSIPKRQLCQTKPEYALRDLFHKLCPNSDDLDSKRFFRRSYKHQSAVYKAECNLYVFSHRLLSCKTQRYLFKRYFQQPSSDCWKVCRTKMR